MKLASELPQSLLFGRVAEAVDLLDEQAQQREGVDVAGAGFDDDAAELNFVAGVGFTIHLCPCLELVFEEPVAPDADR